MEKGEGQTAVRLTLFCAERLAGSGSMLSTNRLRLRVFPTRSPSGGKRRQHDGRHAAMPAHRPEVCVR
ncbi:MAG: hypothetical protein IPJ94_22735 [Chloroflexi bacterium]|nr:hypothetical protein [Chloroflexota bacterium]